MLSVCLRVGNSWFMPAVLSILTGMAGNMLTLYFNPNKIEAKDNVKKLTDFEYVVHHVDNPGDFAFKAQSFSYFVIIMHSLPEQEKTEGILMSVLENNSVNHKSPIVLIDEHGFTLSEDCKRLVHKTLASPLRFSHLLEVLLRLAEKKEAQGKA